jgi:type I restriction enzyme S subunit
MEVDRIPFSELLGEVIDNRGRTCPTTESGIPLIATNCIRNELLYPTYDKVRYVSQETYDTWFRGHPQPGDIIFVNKATPGRVCLVPDPIDFCIAQDMVAVRANPKKVYPKYLFAVLRSPDVQEKIEQLHVGTLIPHFKKGDFNKLLLPVPKRDLQEFIGDVYFNFSNKIELNRRMNETLEALAQTLFKSWFVDPTQSALPKDWEIRGLDEIAVFLNGLALQKFPSNSEDSLPVIKIAQLRAGHTEGADRAGTNLPSQYVIEDGDVLFSWSGSLLVDIWCGGRGALNQHLFKVTSEKFPKWFYYLWTRHHLAAFQNTAADKATTMGHIQRHHLSQAKVFVPTAAELEKMDKQMSPLIGKLIANNLESRTLAALRDALLPKLLSGELRLPLPANLAEAAA